MNMMMMMMMNIASLKINGDLLGIAFTLTSLVTLIQTILQLPTDNHVEKLWSLICFYSLTQTLIYTICMSFLESSILCTYIYIYMYVRTHACVCLCPF